jgi:hypothetical protein
MRNILKYLFCFALLFSCEKKELRKVVALEPFDKIELNDFFEVFLIQDTVCKLEIVASPKIVNKVKYAIENGKLQLDNSYKGNWNHPKSNKVKLYIHVVALKELNATETCNIQTTNTLLGDEIGFILGSKLNQVSLDLNCTTFYAWNNFPCSGKITLTGQVQNLKLWTDALIAVDAKNLIANYALVVTKSKGTVEVNVSSIIDYSIIGNGDIDLYGNPNTIVNSGTVGTGKLVVL